MARRTHKELVGTAKATMWNTGTRSRIEGPTGQVVICLFTHLEGGREARFKLLELLNEKHAQMCSIENEQAR